MKLLAIIGCPKSGTTALARHLGAHPDMVLGRQKEPRHFTDFADRVWTGPGTDRFRATICASWDSYRANFDRLTPDRWAIDSSTDYLWCPVAAERLQRFGQDHSLRLICLTRDPVDRAVSEYNHTLRRNWEPLSLDQALDAEAARMAAGWHPLFYHRRRSTIRDDLHRYHALFGDRLMIVDHAELATPEPLLRRISDFLGIAHQPADRIGKENQTILPRHPLAGAALKNRTLRRVGRWIAPKVLRSRIRGTLMSDARALSTVTPEEIARLRRDLAEEIDRCLDSPLIPTDSWATALDRPHPLEEVTVPR
jgi:hypothetical protein